MDLLGMTVSTCPVLASSAAWCGSIKPRLNVVEPCTISVSALAGALHLCPERRPCLQIIHQEFGCLDCRLPVRTHRDHQDDVFSRHDTAMSMDHRHAEQWPSLLGLLHMPSDFGLRHAGIMLER